MTTAAQVDYPATVIDELTVHPDGSVCWRPRGQAAPLWWTGLDLTAAVDGEVVVCVQCDRVGITPRTAAELSRLLTVSTPANATVEDLDGGVVRITYR